MFNYDLLTKAINNMEQKKQQKKPLKKVDAVAFIEDMSDKYNTIDKYFGEDRSSLLDCGEAILVSNTNIATLSFPLTAKEMMEKL